MLVTTLSFSGFYGRRSIAESVQGTWTGMQKVTVRTFHHMKFSYMPYPDSVQLTVTISESGDVSGTIGNAVFTGCHAKKNRGALGRKLNLFTDFVIAGKLIGPIFPGDPGGTRFISLPFYQQSDKLTGSLFDKQGIVGVYPMVNVSLYKRKFNVD